MNNWAIWLATGLGFSIFILVVIVSIGFLLRVIKECEGYNRRANTWRFRVQLTRAVKQASWYKDKEDV